VKVTPNIFSPGTAAPTAGPAAATEATTTPATSASTGQPPAGGSHSMAPTLLSANRHRADRPWVPSLAQDGSSCASSSTARSSVIGGVPGPQAWQVRLASSSLMGASSPRPRTPHKVRELGGGVSGPAGTLGGMSDVLRARGLVKTYRRGRAVDGVDLTVRPGERVALLGPNGAGKTTTLLMCLGVVEPDGGTVEVVGHRLPKGRSAAMARVGFAAGYLPLPERLRVREYLRMYGQLYGLADPDEQAARGLARFGVPHLSRAMGTELSSGQKTLVGIVKSTMHEPELLVLDEPTASLDPDVAMRVRTGLSALCEERGTALLVTSHNMLEVERIAERVIFLSDGRVVADGPPAEVAARFGRDGLEEVFLHLADERQASEHVEGMRP
jgi:ABC-2 type transport system ATP-binding protein